MTLKALQDTAREGFKDKSALYINGRLSPMVFDDWFLEQIRIAYEAGYKEGEERERLRIFAGPHGGK